MNITHMGNNCYMLENKKNIKIFTKLYTSQKKYKDLLNSMKNNPEFITITNIDQDFNELGHYSYSDVYNHHLPLECYLLFNKLDNVKYPILMINTLVTGDKDDLSLRFLNHIKFNVSGIKEIKQDDIQIIFKYIVERYYNESLDQFN